MKLYYNILLFNLIIEQDDYEQIKELMINSIKNKVFTNKNISDFYFIKVFDNKNIIKMLYFKSNNQGIKEFNNNIKIDLIKTLENEIDKILEIYAPFFIPYKKIEYLLKESINSLNKKTEKVFNYLDGYCLEDEIKNIISMENEQIIQLPNLYYIFLNDDITFIEFDLICLIKENKTLNFNKSIFDRVSYMRNLKLFDIIDNIKGLSLIFFDIKSSQHFIGVNVKHLIEKLNFLYPLFRQYLEEKYTIEKIYY